MIENGVIPGPDSPDSFNVRVVPNEEKPPVVSQVEVISVLMGLGHMRAAYPLRDISADGILIYGSRRNTPPREYRIWKKIRHIYYLVSRIGNIPVIGKYLLAPMLALQRIDPYYPVKDRSKANMAVKYLNLLIKRKGLCAALQQRITDKTTHLVHTFYATAIAMDNEVNEGGFQENYLLICDADFNRVWVPGNPHTSRIKYLAPCTQVKKRLLSYGVREENIFLTGFPLPKENLGSKENLEILKEDLWKRLLRLDPTDKFFSFHRQSVFYWLNKRAMPKHRENHFTLTFAVGGSGAQVDMIGKMLKSLQDKIRAKKITLYLSAGIQKPVFEQILGYINALQLSSYIDRGITIVFDTDIYQYMEKFNRVLRVTDVLWTKPSELSFYCGLGIPILIAPPIGTHEELNKRWLREIHAGLTPPGELEYTHEWLFDLRENGRLAEAAWDGFLKARKLGTYQIEELVCNGNFTLSQHPLEQ